MYSNLHEVPDVVRRIITSVGTLHKVDFDRGDEYDGDADDRSVVTDLEEANAISSSKGHPYHSKALLLDIDLPAALLKSSHNNHLYVELPNYISQSSLKNFLKAAAEIGLIQEGYAEASITRGFTTLRLPWIKKEVKING